jgi:stage II sporulation protein P
MKIYMFSGCGNMSLADALVIYMLFYTYHIFPPAFINLTWTCPPAFRQHHLSSTNGGSEGMAPKKSYMDQVRSRSGERRSPMAAKKVIQSVFALALTLGAFIFMASGGRMGQIVNVLSAHQFPFEIILLEGIPSLSQPKYDYLMESRAQTMTLGLFLLTGVNIADQRTYFLHYLSPPQEGPAWLGWAYSPRDPEMEGTPQDTPEHPPGGSDSPYTPSKPEHPVAPGTVLVGLYNTHTSESYTGNGGKERADKGERGDISALTKAFASELNARNIPTVHDPSVNDTVFSQSYVSSQTIARGLLKQNPDIRLLLDIHRDGLPQAVGRRTTKINGKDTARIMIIIGQRHDNWTVNDKLAQRIIQIGEAKYPGLFLPRVHYAADARYNQHLSPGALLFEVGSQLNTLEEAMNALGPLADVLKQCLQE